MLNEIRAIKKTNDHTIIILKKMMKTGEFRSLDHAFVVLRATMKALRDRIGPGEAFHLAGQLPALLRGYFFEGFDLANVQKVQGASRDVNQFMGEVKNYIDQYDFMDLEKVVPIALNVLLQSIDQGEADQVVNQLPTEIQNLFAP